MLKYLLNIIQSDIIFVKKKNHFYSTDKSVPLTCNQWEISNNGGGSVPFVLDAVAMPFRR